MIWKNTKQNRVFALPQCSHDSVYQILVVIKYWGRGGVKEGACHKILRVGASHFITQLPVGNESFCLFVVILKDLLRKMFQFYCVPVSLKVGLTLFVENVISFNIMPSIIVFSVLYSQMTPC